MDTHTYIFSIPIKFSNAFKQINNPFEIYRLMWITPYHVNYQNIFVGLQVKYNYNMVHYVTENLTDGSANYYYPLPGNFIMNRNLY